MQQQFVYHDICDGPRPLNLPIVDEEKVPPCTMGLMARFCVKVTFKLELDLVI